MRLPIAADHEEPLDKPLLWPLRRWMMRPWMSSECARNPPPGRVVTRPPQSYPHLIATQLVIKWSPFDSRWLWPQCRRDCLTVGLPQLSRATSAAGGTSGRPKQDCREPICEVTQMLPRLQWEHYVYNNATVVAVPAWYCLSRPVCADNGGSLVKPLLKPGGGG